MYHQIQDILIDDDQDSIIFTVKLNEPTKGGAKASCHVGYKSCFYRKVEVSNGKLELKYTEDKKAFDPEIVYKGTENPTKLWLPIQTKSKNIIIIDNHRKFLYIL